jgi:lysophospholipase L1-like esterase
MNETSAFFDLNRMERYEVNGAGSPGTAVLWSDVILTGPMNVEPSRSWRARAATFGLLLGGCAAALVLLEVFLRVVNPFGHRLRGDEIVLPVHTRHVLQNHESPKLDREIVLSKNGLGFRGPELPRDPERWLTIVAIGGSTTECRFLTDGRDWPAVLARELSSRLRNTWVNNAGLDGHSTYGHALLLGQRVAALHPKVVLFLVGVNDVERDDLKSQDRALAERRDTSLVTRLARHSAIVAALQNLGRAREAEQLALRYRQLDLLHLPRLEPDAERTERVLRRQRHEYVRPFRERLDALLRLCAQEHITPVLLTQPALYGPAVDDVTGVDLARVEVDARRRWDGALAWGVLEEYNEATREAAAAAGAPLVDLARDLPKSSRFFYDFVHFTNEGSEAVGQLVNSQLCGELAARFPDFVERPCP